MPPRLDTDVPTAPQNNFLKEEPMPRKPLLLLAVLSLTALAPIPLLTFAGEKSEPGKPIALFNGSDLKGWKFKGPSEKSKWVVGRATVDEKDPKKFVVIPIPKEASGGPAARLLINESTGVDLYSEQKFGDCLVEVEFMIPKGSNSGVYLMGEYEVQIYDTFGKKKPLGPGDMGGIYQNAAPKVDACKKYGEWQKFVIDFRAPRFKEGKKVENAKFLKVTFNDQVIHENVEMKKGVTPGGLTGKEVEKGPLMFQGNHGPVAFRTVKVTPK
jgi:hypothetical protein